MHMTKKYNILHDETTSLFLALIRCGIGKVDRLPFTPSREQWDELFNIAGKQTLQGIAYAGIERLPQEQRPYKELLLRWYHLTLNIRKRNRELTRTAIMVSEKFRKEGFGNSILKGQGIALYYPDPELRIPGDIDIWLDGGCDKVLAYIRRITPDCAPKYHHVDFNVMKGCDIEVHYRPTWMYNPLNNKRLQKFFDKKCNKNFFNTVNTSEGLLHVPTVSFNIVYIPIHIYRHLFDEGIGMRQILDYYFVLMQENSAKEKAECVEILKKTGVLRFTQALMYVMQEMFALDRQHMIVEPDSRHGKFLMREIMLSGNFGKMDARFGQASRGYNLQHFKNQFRRSLLLISHYPSETIWNPLFKIWHTIWMKRHRLDTVNT